MRISALARLAGLPASSVRHYTTLGLLPVVRVNQKHFYTEHAYHVLCKVMNWRAIGLSLAEIDAQLSKEVRARRQAVEAVEEHAKPFAPGEGSVDAPASPRVVMPLMLLNPTARSAVLNDPRFTSVKEQRRALLRDTRGKLERRREEIDRQLEKLTQLEGEGGQA